MELRTVFGDAFVAKKSIHRATVKWEVGVFHFPLKCAVMRRPPVPRPRIVIVTSLAVGAVIGNLVTAVGPVCVWILYVDVYVYAALLPRHEANPDNGASLLDDAITPTSIPPTTITAAAPSISARLDVRGSFGLGIVASGVPGVCRRRHGAGYSWCPRAVQRAVVLHFRKLADRISSLRRALTSPPFRASMDLPPTRR